MAAVIKPQSGSQLQMPSARLGLEGASLLLPGAKDPLEVLPEPLPREVRVFCLKCRTTRLGLSEFCKNTSAKVQEETASDPSTSASSG